MESGILLSREIDITETDAPLLVQKLAAREYSSYEVRLDCDGEGMFRRKSQPC